MNNYVISYDLYSPTLNRKKVDDSIESIGICRKIVTTTYLVSTSKNIYEVESIAKKYIDLNDKIIIAEIKVPIKYQLPYLDQVWVNAHM